MKQKDSIVIPLEKVEFGINLIRDNVFEFVKDVRLLLSESRTAHVVGLLELAIQELGKAELLKQKFREQMKMLMHEVKEGKLLTQRSIRMEEFYDHNKKHDIGIKLLREDVRKIEQQIFSPFSSGGFLSKDVNINESSRLNDFYVNWENEDWRLPSPTMTFGDFMPPNKLLIQLKTLSEAIEEAAKTIMI